MIKSVFDLEGRDLELFHDKYGDIFEPKFVDLEYYKLYYLGRYDPLIKIFDYLKSFPIEKVLYPASYIHLAPSYVFSDVTYVDVYPNIDDFFQQEDVIKYINLHKYYKESCHMKFFNDSFVNFDGLYDLVISSNINSVAIDCKKNIRKDGYLLVNNGHSDADNAFLDKDYKYLGYFKFEDNNETLKFIENATSKKSDIYYLFQYK